MNIKAVDATALQTARVIKKHLKKKPLLMVKAYNEAPDIFKKEGNISSKAIAKKLSIALGSGSACPDEKVITKDLLVKMMLPENTSLDEFTKTVMEDYFYRAPKVNDSSVSAVIDMRNVLAPGKNSSGWEKKLNAFIKQMSDTVSGGDIKNACDNVLHTLNISA